MFYWNCSFKKSCCIAKHYYKSKPDYFITFFWIMVPFKHSWHLLNWYVQWLEAVGRMRPFIYSFVLSCTLQTMSMVMMTITWYKTVHGHHHRTIQPKPPTAMSLCPVWFASLYKMYNTVLTERVSCNCINKQLWNWLRICHMHQFFGLSFQMDSFDPVLGLP